MRIYDKLVTKESTLAVIGLGYVGLPIALEFSKYFKVVGFDVNSERINMMQEGKDPSNELETKEFKNKDIIFTDKLEDLKEVSFFIIAVPTPIDEAKQPDLKFLFSATKLVAQNLKKEDYVVFESTVYPGCTEEECQPILEEESELKCGDDFKIGYSPERINPGDKKNTLTKVTKVVSGSDKDTLEQIAKVYGRIIEAGVYKAKSIKVAEAAKIIENTQRDVNIALINELSIIFSKLGINTYDVLDAATTKWNFLKFYPGLVGGHCIGVDPYYLSYKAKKFGYHPQVIDSGRFVNDSMGGYIAKQTVKKIIQLGKHISESKILVMGVTFKENISDIRNSKVVSMVREFLSYKAKVDLVDPCANPIEFQKEYDLELKKMPDNDYDAIVVAVSHQSYLDMTESYFQSLTNEHSILVDIKGIYRNIIKNMTYLSL